MLASGALVASVPLAISCFNHARINTAFRSNYRRAKSYGQIMRYHQSRLEKPKLIGVRSFDRATNNSIPRPITHTSSDQSLLSSLDKSRRGLRLSRRDFSTASFVSSTSHYEQHQPYETFADFESDDPVGAKLIPLVNQLQEAITVVGGTINFPQIVVVGSQSSGKSSVLESLVGRDFLPRGTGIVTRRPLLLQLHRNVTSQEVFAIFAHDPSRRFTDFNEVRKEIEKETERLAGKNKGISAEPIVLKIHSPNVLPLSLVDLPGVTRVPVGDQPKDIEIQIRNLVMQYISKPNTIILAITAANQDVSTSDALQLAREVDPQGLRTVGVLTKLDLMDQGTDASDILLGRFLPLRLGFVGVVNRSQRDIHTQKSIRDAWKAESEFFRSHPAYAGNGLVPRSGSRFLGLKLNKILTDHIRTSLHGLRAQVTARNKAVKEQLKHYGDAPLQLDSKAAQGWYLLQLLNRFAESFSAAIEGHSKELSTSELNGGARIRYIFQETFAKRIRSGSPLESLTLAQFRTALRNASGPRSSLFVPELAFEQLVRKQIEQLREPSLQCAELIFLELLRIVTQLENKEIQRFPALRERVEEVANQFLGKLLAPTREMINRIIDCELAYINTNHPDFVGTQAVLRANNSRNSPSDDTSNSSSSNSENVEREFLSEPSSPSPSGGGLFGFLFGSGKEEKPARISGSTSPPSSPSSNKSSKKASVLDEPPATIRVDEELTSVERTQISLIKVLLKSYYGICSKNVQDLTTKAIWHYMVSKAKADLQKELVQSLYKENLFTELLRENDQAAMKRKALQSEREALKKAKHTLQLLELKDEASSGSHV